MQRRSLTRRRLCFVAITITLALGTVGCTTSENVAQGFIRAVASGDAGKALDYVCVEGVSVVFALQMDWSDDYYKIIGGDDKEAQVLVSGRAQITSGNLERFFQDSGIELPRAEAGLQVGVNFDGMYIMHDELRNRWCVEDRSISGLRDYLIDLFSQELSGL